MIAALNGDLHFWNAFTGAWYAVVVEIPVDFAPDLNLKRCVHCVQHKRVVFVRVAGCERCIAGVHEPRFCADGTVEVETPCSGHQQFC